MEKDMPGDDPKSNQSGIEVTLGYIQRDIRKIEENIAKIQTENVTRLELTTALGAIRKEFTDAVTGLRNDIANLQKKEEIPTFWQRNQDKIVWGVIFIIMMLFYYLLTHAGFPNFLH